MRKKWIYWLAGIVLGLSLSAVGCSKKESASDNSQSPGNAAPAMQTENAPPEGPPAPSASDEQNPAAPNTEKNPASERKTQRG